MREEREREETGSQKPGGQSEKENLRGGEDGERKSLPPVDLRREEQEQSYAFQELILEEE